MAGRSATVDDAVGAAVHGRRRPLSPDRPPREPGMVGSLLPGLLAGWPFLLVGLLSLLLGILLLARVVRLFPSSSLPLWVLFLGIGILALAGACLGAIAPEEPRTEPVRRSSPGRAAPKVRPPLRPAAPAWVASSEPEEEEPPAPLSERDAVEPLAEEGPSHPSWDEEFVSEDPDGERTAALFSLPLPPPAPEPFPEDFAVDGLPLDPPQRESGEVLAQLEQLSSLLRPVHSFVPSPGPSALVRYCLGCEKRLPEEPAPTPCRACHGPLCAECARASYATGAGGRCSTCASLEQAGSDGPVTDPAEPF